VTRLLLDYGADIEAEDRYGQTPLSVAARAGNGDVVALLMERGAYVVAEDYHGRTPAQWARMGGYIVVARLLDQSAIAKARSDRVEIGGIASMVVAVDNSREI
jgi:ankyrin repeat protein